VPARPCGTRCRARYGWVDGTVRGEGGPGEGVERFFSNANISVKRRPQALIIYNLVQAYSGHSSGIKKLLQFSPFRR
jgi:hypothetical protein